ncbi:MAG: RNA-binding S4 domain-containing protein [Flavipsychrobacter sp.]|jgi:ribosome-associated heat shock protein Hsp15|nr:RNA-binding S4 domain-containing protein [Chitinophagales bacterium]
MADEKLRLDKYLWSIRIFKTRTLATKACEEGKVKLNGANVKPARSVSIGEIYDIRAERKWTIRVTGLLQKRVGFEEAIKNYTDLTSEEDLQYNKRMGTSFYTGKRLSKTGRPSKKERRDLNDFLSDDDAESED